ncbi:hypothetical protein [Rhodococcoides fascians]|nr:hypothetical protein [Rhodococcus fascians]
MTDNPTFIPADYEGQVGWVLMPDGRRAYCYDDLIIDKGTAT